MKIIEEIMHNVFSAADGNLNRLTAGRMRVKYEGCQYSSLEEITSLDGGEEDIVSGVGMTLMASPTLMMLMVFTPEARLGAARILLGEGGLSNAELVDSVLQEIGNIFGSALANGLAKYLDEPVKTSPPEVAMDMAGSMLASIVGSVPDLGDEILLLNMRLETGDSDSACGIHIFFDEKLREKIDALPSVISSE
jgi:chemotaxis protein CheY-P-specific phosphatase CheC